MAAADSPSDLANAVTQEDLTNAFRGFIVECRRHTDAIVWFHMEEASEAALNVINLTSLGPLNLAAWAFMAEICHCPTFLAKRRIIHAFWTRAAELLRPVNTWRREGIEHVFAFMGRTFEALPEVAREFFERSPSFLSTCIVLYERQGMCTSKDPPVKLCLLNNVLKILHTYAKYTDIIGTRTVAGTLTLLDQFCQEPRPTEDHYQMIELSTTLMAQTFDLYATNCSTQGVVVRARTLVGAFHHLMTHSKGEANQNAAIVSLVGCFGVLVGRRQLCRYHLLPAIAEPNLNLFLETASSKQASYLLNLLELMSAEGKDPVLDMSILARRDLFETMNERVATEVASMREILDVVRLAFALTINARTQTLRLLISTGLHDTLHCLQSSRTIEQHFNNVNEADVFCRE